MVMHGHRSLRRGRPKGRRHKTLHAGGGSCCNERTLEIKVVPRGCADQRVYPAEGGLQLSRRCGGDVEDVDLYASGEPLLYLGAAGGSSGRGDSLWK
jgi:hypothetical protein